MEIEKKKWQKETKPESRGMREFGRRWHMAASEASNHQQFHIRTDDFSH